MSRTEHAAEIIAALGRPNLALMFDCYHTQIEQGDLSARLKTHIDIIGHIQIAGVPGRGEPDRGEVCYSELIKWIRMLGYGAPIGAEYQPHNASTVAGLGWLKQFAESADEARESQRAGELR